MPANNKIITLDNLTEYDTKIKEYILNSALRELTEDTNIWELSQGIYRAAPGIKLYYNTNSGCITVGAYGDLLSVALSNNGSTPFYLMGRSVQGNETINTIVVGVAQNNLYGVCDVYDMAEMRSVVHIYNNQTIYGKKTFNTLPESSVVPTTDKQLVNKKYVDDKTSTKQDTLVSGTNIKTINNESLLGSGDITISGGGDTIYIGTSADHDTEAKALDITGLDEGIYMMTVTSESGFVELWLKATRPTGLTTCRLSIHRNLQPIMNNVCYLHITKKVDNDLANGTIFGYFTCFALVGGTYLYKLKLSLLFSTTNYAMIYSDNSTYQGCMTTSSVDTITAKKTFNVLPESSVAPTTDKQLVNKKYVDDSILDNAIYLGKVTDYNTQEKALNFDNLKEGVYYITFDSSTLYCKLTNSQGVVTTKSFAFPGIDYKLSLIIYLVVPADIIPEETQANSLIATFQYLRHGTSYISGESDYALVNQKFIARTDSSNYLTIVESKGAREYVSATYTQTISGKKTFNTLPESSVVPTGDNQLVNKKYVDDSIPSIEECTNNDIDSLFTSGGEE